MAGIKQIAELANVSIGTVDRVIHNRGGVAQRTIEKVRQVMQELDYQPDIHASNLSSKRVYRLAALLPELSQDGGFWKEPAKGIKAAISELERHRIHADIYYYDEWNIDSFVRAIDKIVDDGCCGILIAPATISDNYGVFRRIPRDIPYVLYDTFVPGVDCISYVGENSTQAGRSAAQLMNDMVLEGKILALRSLPGTDHINRRVEGFRQYCAEKGRFIPEVIDIDCTVSDQEMQAFFSDIYDSIPEVGGIFMSSGMIYRIVDSVEHFWPISPRLIGYDLTPNNRSLLRQGRIDYVIGQRPEEQAYLGMQILYRQIVLQKPSPREIIVPIDIICRENEGQYAAMLTLNSFSSVDI
ncbi:LacI family DNA-binding transcriptional regulator [Spirochaeta dissipatitropha]